jgi:hypothetical protein
MPVNSSLKTGNLNYFGITKKVPGLPVKNLNIITIEFRTGIVYQYKQKIIKKIIIVMMSTKKYTF